MPDLDTPYEPWHPHPGQRVRIRRSGECPGAHHIANRSDDGGAGKVVARRPWPVSDHPYIVAFDTAIPTGATFPTHLTRGYYAAVELEPDD